MKLLFKVSNYGPELKNATVGHSNFREHYAGINSNTSWLTLLPTIKAVTRDILIPRLGRDLYDDLANKYDAGTALEDYQEEILELCQAVVAYFSMISLPAELLISVSDMGVVEKGATTPVNPVAQWRYKESKFQLTTRADKAIDSLIATLDNYVSEEISYFNLYKESTAYTLNRTVFFSSAKQFNRYVQINNSRRLFDELILDMQKAEEDVDHIICESQFNVLSDALKSDELYEELGEADKTLIEKIRRYVAAKAVSLCTPRLFVTLDVNGLSLSSYTDGFSGFNHHSATFRGAEAADAFLVTLKSDAEVYFKDLVAYIHDNIDDLPLIKESACYESYTSASRIPICTGYGAVMF